MGGGFATIFFFVGSQWETGDSINKGWYSTQILIVINIRGITIENIYFLDRFTHRQSVFDFQNFSFKFKFLSNQFISCTISL